MEKLRTQLKKICKYFNTEQERYIYELMAYSTDRLSKKTKFFLFKCINSINYNTPDYKKELFIELLEQIFIKDTEDNVDILSSGENFFIEVRLRKDEDLTGSIILAREDETNDALSDQTLKGNDEPIQRVDCLDLDLTPNTFYKIKILAEGINQQGSANGDGLALINFVYLFVTQSIDT